MDGQRFDALTKSLGSTSRRRALRLLAGGALGGVLAKIGLADVAAQDVGTAAATDCRTNRQCTANQRCCNGRCLNVLSDERACGTCGNRCADGETCINGGCFRQCRGAQPGVCDTNSCGNLCGCNNIFNGANGGGVCESLRGSCADAVACRTNTDCGRGLVCVNDGCCPGKPRICARPCGTDAAPASVSTSGATRVPGR